MLPRRRRRRVRRGFCSLLKVYGALQLTVAGVSATDSVPRRSISQLAPAQEHRSEFGRFRFSRSEEAVAQTSQQGVQVAFGSFPDNGACKRGGSLPTSRDQPGLQQTCCCQICPAQFLVELQLLQLSAEETLDTYINFHQWYRGQLGLEGPSPLPSRPGHGANVDHLSSRSLEESEQVLAFLETDAFSRTRASPWKAADMNMVVEGGPCCPLCPSSFAPRRADAIKKPLVFLEQGVGVDPNLKAQRAPQPSPALRKKQTRGYAGAAQPPLSSFVETAGVFNDNAAMSKSMSDRTGEGDPTCCNICVSQQSVPQTYADVVTHPDQMAKSGLYSVPCSSFIV